MISGDGASEWKISFSVLYSLGGMLFLSSSIVVVAVAVVIEGFLGRPTSQPWVTFLIAPFAPSPSRRRVVIAAI